MFVSISRGRYGGSPEWVQYTQWVCFTEVSNECLPQKQYDPEGTHGTPPGEKKCLQVLGHSVRLILVGGSGWQCLLCDLLSG